MMYFLLVSFPEAKRIERPTSAAMSVNLARNGLPEAALREAGGALRVANPWAETYSAAPRNVNTQSNGICQLPINRRLAMSVFTSFHPTFRAFQPDLLDA